MTRVFGTDSSLRATGVCLPDGSTFTIATGEAKRGDTRLHVLRTAYRAYIRRALPVTLGVIEVPQRFQSGDAALAAGMVQGICREVMVEYGIPFAKVNPADVKMFATGRGNADKPLMIATANRHRFALHGKPDGMYDDLVDDNQADAWWLRAMGRWYLGLRELDPALDEWLNPHLIRDAKTITSKGTKWPGTVTRSAARTSRATPPAR